MPFRTLSSLKLIKVSLASGTTTVVLSWVNVLNETAMIIKDLGIIFTGAVAIWTGVVYFNLEIQKIKTKIRNKHNKDDNQRS